MSKAVNYPIVEEEYVTILRGAVRSKHTLDLFERRLVELLSDIGKTRDEFVVLAKSNPATEIIINGFLLKKKQRAEQRSIVTTTTHGSPTTEILVVYIRFCKVVTLLSNYLIQGPLTDAEHTVGREVVEVL